MTAPPSRRGFVLGATVALLAGCADDEPDAAPASTPSPAPSAPVTPAPRVTDLSAAVATQLAALEKAYDARLGVFARDTGTGAVLANRADERFAMCSTFKALAAAAVLQRGGLERNVPIRKRDLLDPSPVTGRHLGGAMTLAALCEAAVQVSDNTAGNLLLRELGGPAGLTRFARSLGDGVTRLDRTEPDLNAATPGDPRDTTTPRAFATTLEAFVLGTALDAADRRVLTGWLEGTTTGANRIRAGTPPGWRVADKTGTGSYGTANDVAVLWPPGRDPIVLAVLTDRPSVGPDARRAHAEGLLADATRAALGALLRIT